MLICIAGITPAPLLSSLHRTTQRESLDPLKVSVPLEPQRCSFAAVPGFFPRLETCHTLQCCYSLLPDRLRTAVETLLQSRGGKESPGDGRRTRL